VIRHVVVFRWAAGTTAADVAEVAAGLAQLPALIPALRAYRFGPDLGLRAGNADFAVVADVDDAEGWRAYAEHPAHRAVLEERILPIVAERASVQFEI